MLRDSLSKLSTCKEINIEKIYCGTWLLMRKVTLAYYAASYISHFSLLHRLVTRMIANNCTAPPVRIFSQ